MKLEIKKFDLSKVKDDKVIVIIGRRGSGKSYLLRDIMYNHRDIPVGTVISPTESANQYFGHFIPDAFIHDEYKPSIVSNFVRRQADIVSKMNEEEHTYGRSTIDPRAFLIFDDCMYDSSWVKDPNIRYIFMNGRHVKIFYMLSMQFPLGITPNLRANIDYVFLFKTPYYSDKKRIYEHYAGMFPTFDMFNQTFNQLTDDRGIMVIDNTSQSSRIEDTVYWYRAEDRGQFHVGLPQFWINNNPHRFSRRSDEQDEPYDPERFQTKKNSPRLNVFRSPLTY